MVKTIFRPPRDAGSATEGIPTVKTGKSFETAATAESSYFSTESSLSYPTILPVWSEEEMIDVPSDESDEESVLGIDDEAGAKSSPMEEDDEVFASEQENKNTSISMIQFPTGTSGANEGKTVTILVEENGNKDELELTPLPEKQTAIKILPRSILGINFNLLSKFKPGASENELRNSGEECMESRNDLLFPTFDCKEEGHYKDPEVNTCLKPPSITLADDIESETSTTDEMLFSNRRARYNKHPCNLKKCIRFSFLLILLASLSLGITLGFYKNAHSKSTSTAAALQSDGQSSTASTGESENENDATLPNAIEVPKPAATPAVETGRTDAVSTPITGQSQVNESLESSPSASPTTCRDVLYINKPCFSQPDKEVILATFWQCDPKPDDWIGIFPVRDDNTVILGDNYSDWLWACGNTSCQDPTNHNSMIFDPKNLETGTRYQMFLVRDHLDGEHYDKVAGSIIFEVGQDCDL